ncbi:hypothetical protein GJ744_006738 [Endocarpon pusillum]|uniref:Uncharacterized protein n=1 Tax=Endocarpon pusillum TaxID=364733 RepID=A0A8H7E4R2_9EURO|nr:hypothetical protein GJ744_006738 [Endocarpon pusillum]
MVTAPFLFLPIRNKQTSDSDRPSRLAQSQINRIPALASPSHPNPHSQSHSHSHFRSQSWLPCREDWATDAIDLHLPKERRPGSVFVILKAVVHGQLSRWQNSIRRAWLPVSSSSAPLANSKSLLPVIPSSTAVKPAVVKTRANHSTSAPVQ